MALLDARPRCGSIDRSTSSAPKARPRRAVLVGAQGQGLERDRVYLLMGTFRATFAGAVELRAGKEGRRRRGTQLALRRRDIAPKSLVLVAGEG